MYYRGAQGAIVVFDVTNRESFEGAKSWVKELQRRGDPTMVIALAGNKGDLRDRRVVHADEAEEYARSASLLYSETSAKSGEGVERIFADVARKVPRTQPLGAPAGALGGQKKDGVVALGGGAGAPGGGAAGKKAGGGGCC
jgi:GTPase SAR1 family protein